MVIPPIVPLGFEFDWDLKFFQFWMQQILYNQADPTVDSSTFIYINTQKN